MAISDKQKQEIHKESKKILDSFSEKLERIDTQEEHVIERSYFEREEGSEEKPELDRDLMFENAPNKDKNKDFILAEKGGW